MKMIVRDLLPLPLVDNRIILLHDQGNDNSNSISISNISIIVKKREEGHHRNIGNLQEVIVLSLQNEKVKDIVPSPLEGTTTTEVSHQEGTTTIEAHHREEIVPSLPEGMLESIVIVHNHQEEIGHFHQEETLVPNRQEEIVVNQGKDQTPRSQNIENQKVTANYHWEEKRKIVDMIKGTAKTIKKRIGSHHLYGH